MHKMEKEGGREGTLEKRERRYVGKERWKRIVNEKSKRNRKRRGKIVRKGQRKGERLECDLIWVERLVNEKSKRNRKRRGKIVRKGQRKRERLYCDLVWVEEGVSGDWSGEGNGLLFLGPVGRGCPW